MPMGNGGKMAQGRCRAIERVSENRVGLVVQHRHRWRRVGRLLAERIPQGREGGLLRERRSPTVALRSE